MLTKNFKKGDRKKESTTIIDGHEPELKAAYPIFHRAIEALTSDPKLSFHFCVDLGALLQPQGQEWVRIYRRRAAASGRYQPLA